MENVNVAEAVARARAQADQAVATTVVDQPVASTAVVPGKPRTLADALNNAGSVAETYLSLKYQGMFIDKANDMSLIREFKATLRLQDVKPLYMIRYMVGGQAKYARSTDNVVNAENGEPWQKTIADAKRIDPKLERQYDAFDLTFVVTEDVHAGGKSPVKAGTKVGYTTSVTVYKSVLPAIQKFMAMGFQMEQEIPVLVKHVPKKKGTNEWGAIELELISN